MIAGYHGYPLVLSPSRHIHAPPAFQKTCDCDTLVLLNLLTVTLIATKITEASGF